MKLSVYLKTKGIKNRDFAKLIGVHELSIPRYNTGKSTPSLPTMQKIREATNGDVDIDDFLSKGDV